MAWGKAWIQGTALPSAGVAVLLAGSAVGVAFLVLGGTSKHGLFGTMTLAWLLGGSAPSPDRLPEHCAGATVTVIGKAVGPIRRRTQASSVGHGKWGGSSLDQSFVAQVRTLPSIEKRDQGECEFDGRLHLRVKASHLLVTRGALWVWRGRLRSPQASRFPFDFDGIAWSQSRGLAGSLGVSMGAPVKAEGAGLAGLQRALDGWRHRVSEGLERSRASPWLKTWALGDPSDLGPEERRRWQGWGLSHALAVSGLHLGILLWGLVSLVLGLLALPPTLVEGRNMRAPIAVLASLILWCLVAGWGAPDSACRAGLLAQVYLIGWWVGRPFSFIQAWAATVALLGVWDLQALQRPGVQLSLLGAMAAYRAARGEGSLLQRALRMAILPSLATAPLVILHFGTWAAVAPLANFVLLPLLSTVYVPLALACAWLPGLSDSALVEALFDTLGWLPALTTPLAVPWRLRWAALGTSSVIAIAQYRATLPRLAALSLLSCVFAYWPHAPASDGRLHIYQPYVGHGDAALVVGPEGEVIVVDAAGREGVQGLLHLLAGLGIRRIDRLVLSHADADHSAGIEVLAAKVAIERVVYASANPYVDRLARTHPGLDAGPPEKWRDQLGGLSLTYWQARAQRENNRSLTLEVGFGERSIFFGGDIEAEAEAQLPTWVGGEVLKVPHHGSATSSTPVLLQRLSPLVALVSHRRGDPLFPAESVRRRFESQGISWLSTAEIGLIHLVGDHRGWREVSMAPGGAYARQSGRVWPGMVP